MTSFTHTHRTALHTHTPQPAVSPSTMSTNTFSADEDAGEDDLLILESNEAAEDDTELTLESNEAAEDDGALVLESNEATGGDDVGMSDNDDEDDMLILESNQCRAAPQRVRGEAFALEANDARAASDDDGVGASTSMDPGTSATPTETRWLVIHRPMVVIRASPSVRAPVLGMRMAGTDVRVVEACDGWLRIVMRARKTNAHYGCFSTAGKPTFRACCCGACRFTSIGNRRCSEPNAAGCGHRQRWYLRTACSSTPAR